MLKKFKYESQETVSQLQKLLEEGFLNTSFFSDIDQ